MFSPSYNDVRKNIRGTRENALATKKKEIDTDHKYDAVTEGSERAEAEQAELNEEGFAFLGH